MRPMLATRGDHVPAGGGWVHEVKWDGIRLLADVTEGPDGRDRTIRLETRNENDATVAWPELVASTPQRDLLVDGEVIALNDRGVPDFGVLQDRMHVRRAATAEAKSRAVPATFMVFDLLRLDGEDLTRRPLRERRRLLEELVADGTLAGTWQVPGTYDDGAMLLEATREQGLEGIVSKRLDSRYEPGARSRHWLKFPHRPRRSYVVGGWRPETGSTGRVGALLVGEPTPDGLVYRGRVGSGIAGKVGPQLREALEPLARGSSPFTDEVPRVDATGSHWVEPVLVVDVEALGLSTQQRLRQPSYRGLRTDLGPEDLT
ncbi:non-homologous end-joining DNA ligase [Nocardioides sp. GCM10027113]|uniref:non-homologous end-joining DNA ligase n=1 Tax=unclassified Nocardioides TaxID=2615069 RepID=UPI00360B4283